MREITAQIADETDSNTYVYTYMYNCEKGIYESPSLKSRGEVEIFDRPFDHSTSYENAFAARELNLESLLSINDTKKNSLLINISESEKEKILKRVFSYELSPDVQNFTEDYKVLFGKRSEFLWKWLGVVYREAGVTLSTVEPKYLDSVTDTKILFTMLFSILDDTSEFYKDEELLENLLSIISNNSKKSIIDQDNRLVFFKKLWNHFTHELAKLPRYEEFTDMFTYDFNQVINSVRFCYLMNKKPEYMNLQEMEIFGSYNMIVFLLNGIDLMASPKFDEEDLPHIRTIFWNSQQMARIGNWLSTWKREIKEEDVSSGVFAYALSNNIISIDELKNMNEEEIVKKIEDSNMYEYFTCLWKERFDSIRKIKVSIKSVDIDQYIKGLETLIKLHLASEGHK